MNIDSILIKLKTTIFEFFSFEIFFKCSVELAAEDLQAMEVYRDNITMAATNKV